MQELQMRYADYPLYNYFQAQAHGPDDTGWRAICKTRLEHVKQNIDYINIYLHKLQVKGIHPQGLNIEHQNEARVLDTSFTLKLTRTLRKAWDEIIDFFQHEIVHKKDRIYYDTKRLKEGDGQTHTLSIGFLTAHPLSHVHDIDIVLQS